MIVAYYGLIRKLAIYKQYLQKKGLYILTFELPKVTDSKNVWMNCYDKAAFNGKFKSIKILLVNHDGKNMSF